MLQFRDFHGYGRSVHPFPGAVSRARFASLSAMCAIATTVYLGAPAQASPADSLAALNGQISTVSIELTEAADAITAAKQSLDDVQQQLPEIQAQIAAARTEATAARTAQRSAEQAVAEAEQQATAVGTQISAVRSQLDDLSDVVARIAREAYLHGGDYAEFAVILGSTDPADLVRQLEVLTRQSRGNSDAIEGMTAARESMTAKLAELDQLTALADARRDEAAKQAAAASQSLEQAAAAQGRLQNLIRQRADAVSAEAGNKSRLAAIASRLFTKQEQARARVAAAKARAATKAAEKAAAQAAADAAAAEQPAKSGASATPTPSAPKPSSPVTAPVTGPALTGTAAVAISYALSKVGKAYVGGAWGPNSFDCTGLVSSAWHSAGSGMHQDTVGGIRASKFVKVISQSEAQPGDLIMWNFTGQLSHVGMLLDPAAGTFVHAESTRTGVRISNWKKESFYQHPVSFVRVIR